MAVSPEERWYIRAGQSNLKDFSYDGHSEWEGLHQYSPNEDLDIKLVSAYIKRISEFTCLHARPRDCVDQPALVQFGDITLFAHSGSGSA